MTENKRKQILDMLDTLQEHLLSLPDDMVLYINLLRYLKDQDPAKFSQLPANDKFISNRGNPLFAADPGRLRVAAQLEPRFHCEVNLSANNIRNNIKDLLQEFAIPSSELKIYLREDRDAGAV